MAFNAGFGHAVHGIATIPDTATVFSVDNLNTSGAGSLEAALTAAGTDKIITFNVGGSISLDVLVVAIATARIWVLGSTAPSPINITNGEIRFDDDNTTAVFIEGLRWRTGDQTSAGITHTDPSSVDTLGISGEAIDTVIIKSCSFAYGLDELLRIRNALTKISNICILDCIFAEPLHHSIHPTDPHSYGPLITDSLNITMAGNIHTHHNRRTPRFEDGNLEAINNIYYNPGSYLITVQDTALTANIDAIGNVLLYPTDPANWTDQSTLGALIANRSETNVVNVYNDDNVLAGETFSAGRFGGTEPVVSGTRLLNSGIEALPSAETISSAVANAGAWPTQRDTVDQRAVDQIQNRTGGFIDSQTEWITAVETTGYPVIASTTQTPLLVPPTGKAAYFATFYPVLVGTPNPIDGHQQAGDYLTFECEDFQTQENGSGWSEVADAEYSGGIGMACSDAGSSTFATTLNRIGYTVNIVDPGDYTIYLYCSRGAGAEDSFWISFDDSSSGGHRFNARSDDVHDWRSASTNGLTHTFTAGQHTVWLACYDPLAEADKIVLTTVVALPYTQADPSANSVYIAPLGLTSVTLNAVVPDFATTQSFREKIFTDFGLTLADGTILYHSTIAGFTVAVDSTVTTADLVTPGVYGWLEPGGERSLNYVFSTLEFRPDDTLETGEILVAIATLQATVDALTTSVPNAIYTRQIEGNETFEQMLRISRAFAAGDVVQQVNGDMVIKSADGTVDRISVSPGANDGRLVISTDGT